MAEPICVTEPIPLVPQETTDAQTNERVPRRWMTRAGVCLGSIALGAGIGAYVGTESPTHTKLGGNDATVELNPGSNVTSVDLSLLALRVPSKTSIAGVPVGANVRLNATAKSSPNSEINDAVVGEFLQLFSDPSHDMARISSDTNWHIARDSRNGALGGLFLSSVGMWGYAEHKKARRKLSDGTLEEFSQAYGPLGKRLKLGAGIVSLLALSASGFSGSVPTALTHANTDHIVANPIFNDTPLEGAEIIGPGAALVEQYVTRNDSFYSEVTKNFQNAFLDYYKPSQLMEDKNVVPVVLISDRHCNVGMDRVVAQAAKDFEALIVASGGDDSFSGTFSFESSCTSGLADRLKTIDVQMIAGLGNHDRYGPSNPELSQEITVLDGEASTISTPKGDVTFLSKRDPRRSIFNKSITPGSPEDQMRVVTVQGQELGNLACKNPNPIDILIAHDERAAATALQNGCNNISFTLSGHVHHLKNPIPFNAGGKLAYQFTEGSTGGASPETPSYGPLQTEATLSVLYYDTANHEPMGLVSVTIRPDASVNIGDFMPLAPDVILNNNPAAKDLGTIVNNG